MYQREPLEDNFLEDWEASADQSWNATKKKLRYQFGIGSRASNREAKSNSFESTKSLHKHPFYRRTLLPTPATTQFKHEYDALSEYATELEDQVEELQSVSGEDTVVDS